MREKVTDSMPDVKKITGLSEETAEVLALKIRRELAVKVRQIKETTPSWDPQAETDRITF